MAHKKPDENNQRFQAPPSLRADSSMIPSISIPQPQFAPQQQAQQPLPSPQAPYLTQPAHEPYWAPPDVHSPDPATSYQLPSTGAPQGPFYALQESLEQTWLPGTDHNPPPTMLPLDPNQRWLHYQDNGGIVYAGSTVEHGLPDIGRPS